MSTTPVTPDWGNEPDDDDGIPLTEQPMESQVWVCTGVKVRTLAKAADEPHLLPSGTKPDRPTTDQSGKWRSGKCQGCGANTIWKGVTI